MVAKTNILDLELAVNLTGNEYVHVLQPNGLVGPSNYTDKKAMVGTITAFSTASLQTANTVYAGPPSGVPAGPTFRALVNADIPTLHTLTFDGAGSSIGGLAGINLISGATLNFGSGNIILTHSAGLLTITGGSYAGSFSGSGAALTSLNASNLASGTVPDARFPATLPALSGINLTNLNATNLGSGTVPDARFPATLPAVSGVNLTNLNGANLTNATVTFAKIQNIPTDSLIGRDTAATGAAESITLDVTLEFTGSQSIRRAALTGDVTASAGSNATTIPNNTVTNAKLADMAVNTIKARLTAGTGDPEDLTATQLAALVSSDVSGVWVGTSGNRWGVFPYVGSDGVMEIGRYIDFHNADAGVTDNDVRLDTNNTTTDLYINSTVIYRAGGTKVPTGDIADNAVTYAKIQDISTTQRALGRNTAGAGDTEEVTFSQFLDWVGSPTRGDILYRGASAWTRLPAGTAGQVLQTQGTGADPLWVAAGAPSEPQGCVSLSTGVPMMASTVSGATTVYYTPYTGQFVPLYNGSAFVMTDTGGELSQATSDTTKSPAAVAANKNYDIFVWDNGGTKRATRGPAWSSDTSRGTGAGTTELVRVQGVLLNAQSITNGPASQRGTFVGSIRSNGSSQIDWIFGAIGVGGTASSFGVWNMYNRRNINAMTGDSTNSWTYSSTTWRSANNSAGLRHSFLMGLAEDSFSTDYTSLGANSAGTGPSSPFTAIAYDTTSAPVAGARFLTEAGASSFQKNNDLGWHFVQGIERSSGTGTVTFFGDTTALGNAIQTGLYWEGRL